MQILDLSLEGAGYEQSESSLGLKNPAPRKEWEREQKHHLLKQEGQRLLEEAGK